MTISEDEMKDLINEMTTKPIIFSEDISDKQLVFSEPVMYKDGSADIKKYYIDKGSSMKDPETVVYVDYYSAEKSRKRARKEYERKRRRIK